MIELILPAIVKGAVEIFTKDPETVKALVEVAKENPVIAVVTAMSLPGLILEFCLRRFKSKKRRSIFLGVKKVIFIVRKVLGFVEDAIEYVDKKCDIICKQKIDDELILPGDK